MVRETPKFLPPDLTCRQRVPEWMDDPSLEPGLHEAALRGLARLNRLSRTSAVLARVVSRHVSRTGRPWRLLDVACGGGDVTLGLHRRLQRAKLPVTVHGCDVSEVALAEARRRAKRMRAGVSFFACDVLRDGLPSGYDAMVCSLFLHHLDEAEAERLLRAMAARAKVVIVDDLRRSRWNWCVSWLASRAVTRSPVVRYDAPFSIQGAFTIGELAGLAERAGMEGASVRRRTPARMMLEWEG